MQNLITGTSSGLGKYIFESTNSILYDRNKPDMYNKIKYNFIIHAAHGKQLNNQSFIDYYYSQYAILKNLLKLKFNKFIFISSIDTCSDEDNLSNYALCKIKLENHIKNTSSNYQILRPGLLIGYDMRVNQLLKVAINQTSQLTLSPRSTFGLVFYNDILSIINSNYSGTMNVLPPRIVSLQEVSDYFNTTPNWGDYIYQTPLVSKKDHTFYATDLLKYDPLDRLKLFVKYECWRNYDNFNKYFF